MLRRSLITLFSSSLLYGCLDPTTKIERFAQRAGFTQSVLEGTPFQHTIFTKPANNSTAKNRLHIYIEGDGNPWRYGTQIADDPTSRNPLSLRLMARDTSASLYLGRPCYLGRAETAECSSALWTSHRYSESVVISMAKAANSYIAQNDFAQVSLIGHSGGGALAVLIANKVINVDQVITIAANLDTDSWTHYHGYLPLFGSLNPIEHAQFGDIAHSHYIGGNDRVIPPSIIEDFVSKNGGSLRKIDAFTHQCCWLENWPQLMED